MTIEHLAPQSLIGQAGFDDVLIGQLGNLILVSPEMNEKLRNRPFKEKKAILQAGGLALSDEMKNADDWGSIEIQRRTRSLAETAFKTVWKL